jgi:hypothetical protein
MIDPPVTPLGDDLEWLHGYRLRASGQARPSELESAERSIQAEGWDDLDAVLKLIERALGTPDTG